MEGWLPLKLVFLASATDDRFAAYQGMLLVGRPIKEAPMVEGAPTEEVAADPIVWCVGTYRGEHKLANPDMMVLDG